MTMQHWKTETDGNGVLWLCLDKADARANVLSSEVFHELNDILDPLGESPPAGLVMWSGKDRSFVMGADIKEIDGIESPDRAYELTRLGQQLLDKVENMTCPTVAVINGHCLGGGLELSLAFDYRIALQGEQKIIGLPDAPKRNEVTLYIGELSGKGLEFGVFEGPTVSARAVFDAIVRTYC